MATSVRAAPPAGVPIDNIGIISNSTRTLYDDVQDYPDDESYDTYGADEGGYGDEGYSDEEWAWPADRRWRPAAALIGGVIAVGAIATAVIINSGDSATTKATVLPPRPAISTATRTTMPSTVPSTVPSTAPPLSTTPTSPPSVSRSPLPPETVTTVTPPSSAPTRTPTAAPPKTALPPGAALSPRAVVYSVTGTKNLVDLVTVVYTDEQGFPKTDVNVALPWTKVVVLNPGVQVESVIATSLGGGHLSCTIVNAQGQLVVASTNPGMLATCTK